MGINLEKFLPEMEEALELVVGGTAPAGPLEFDAAKAPKIALLYDPFETGEARGRGRLNDQLSYLNSAGSFSGDVVVGAVFIKEPGHADGDLIQKGVAQFVGVACLLVGDIFLILR